MAVYPVEMLSAQITATGITSLAYDDILESLIAKYQSLYGSDTVMDNSLPDYQDIAIRAQAIYDSNQVAIATYNSFNPATAQTDALRRNVKINGLKVDPATYSTAPVRVVGQTGKTITGGIVSDGTYNWTLPTPITFDLTGEVTVTATCTTLGAIAAAPGTINRMVNPQDGWQSASNTVAATVGAPVESDVSLRNRQTISTSLPASSIMAAIVANVLAVTGVQALAGFENDRDTTDEDGLPPHTISLVVEGGDVTAIAAAIALKKTPGTQTYGTTTVNVTDPALRVPVPINFYVAAAVPIDINITIKAMNGFVSPTAALIQSQEAAYLTGLGIGSSDNFVFNSKLYSPANDTGTVANTYNVTSITARRGTGGFSTADVPIAFNEYPTPGNITVTVV